MNTTTKLSKDVMKKYNQKLILRTFQKMRRLSKSELSKSSALTLPAVADIIDYLESLNLIKSLGESKIERGRSPVIYELNEDSFKVIGVTIRSESIRVGLFNIVGKNIYNKEQELPLKTSPENIIEEVSILVNQLLAGSGTDKNEISGMGIGMHGIVDYVKGIAVYPPHLNWSNVPIKALLEEKIGLPVLVDNDCNSLALAEYWFGNGIDVDSFITLNADYGIGAGIMIEGTIFHGRNFGAGQIGHTIIHDNGPLCSCGNYGCLETLSSEISIVDNVKRKLKRNFPSHLNQLETDPDKLTIELIYQAADSQDELALTTLEEASRYLGVGISTLVNVFNPEKVIITGGLLNGKEYVMKPLYDSFMSHALKTNVPNLEVCASDLGRKADILGAASLWINELFKGETPLSDFKYSSKILA